MSTLMDRVAAYLRQQAHTGPYRDPLHRGRLNPLTGGRLFRLISEETGLHEKTISEMAERAGLWGGVKAVAAACGHRDLPEAEAGKRREWERLMETVREM